MNQIILFMKIFILLSSLLLVAGLAHATPTMPIKHTGIIEAKLSRPIKPVKEKNIYVLPKEEKSVDLKTTGLQIIRSHKPNISRGNQVFVLDSLIGRMESGDYTIKEAYVYDNNGNSKEARMYYWDNDLNNWQINQEILLEWNDENLCTSSINRMINPWDDGSAQKMTMEYDENGFNTAIEVYNLEDGKWIPVEKHIYKYDSLGYMTEELVKVPGEKGEWTNYSKNIAEWTPSGYRTLFEFYLWNGTEWYYSDSRMVYEYDEQGRVLSSLEQVPMGDYVQNFLRVQQTFGPYGLTRQTYEFWNQENENWFGSESSPSMYAEIEYDNLGRSTKETGYIYDFDLSDWTESIKTESEYTLLPDDITREVRTRYDILAGNKIANKVEREYNKAGNDTYWKEYIKNDINGPLKPYEENIYEYDPTGKIIIYAESYCFEDETRIAMLKESSKYDENGNPEESWFWNGKYITTGDGDPEEWVNHTHFIYEYENGEELSRMAYIWEEDQYVPFWGEDVNLNFSVPIGNCIYWMNAEMKYDYQILATRKYHPNGNVFTYEEGVWHYSELNNVGVGAIEDKTDMRIFPNPTADYVNIDCENGAEINIYSIQGALMISTTEHTVDVSGLAKGVYIVNVDGKSARLIKK